ncbi:metallo-beta-lactamase superfamily protein [Mycobacterium xenopi 3993]|nr:metallo-beta-lactamase superfamily protein [Mycobacterium xenopi 3993]
MPDSDRLYFRQLLSGRDFARGDMFATQMRNFAYLIGDRQTGEAVVVDRPTPPGSARRARTRRDAPVGVLVTHHHPDHVGGTMMGFQLKGLSELLERTNVPVHVNTHEALWVSRVTGISMDDLTAHWHGDKVRVGDIEIELLHTPGHTPGSQCFLLDGRLVAGTRCFWKAAGAPTFPAATPTRCTAACSSWPSCPATRQCFPGIGIRPSRVPRCRRSSAPTTSTAPRTWISGEC